ncbi:DBF4-type zinc finger-containing protein 2 isoform X3 [Oryzias latipes]
MCDSSDDGDPGKTDFGHRVWAEPQPGPSRSTVSRQGYCGCCKVLYSNLDQHLSSLRHLDSVQGGESSNRPSTSDRSTLSLLERFLQDVQQYHPHRYSDPRPSHSDLPLVSDPPLPKAAVEEVCFPADDSGSLGNHSSQDASCLSANHKSWGCCSQSGKVQERLSLAVKEQETTPADGRRLSHIGAPPPESVTPPPRSPAPPSVHRKAHRKTNRRKTSDSSSSAGPKRCPPTPPPLDLGPSTDSGAGVGPGPRLPPVTESRPWLSWQRKRKETHKEAFSSDSSDLLQQTIEEVIQLCCYGIGSSHHQQEEPESIHLSLPSSMTTCSEEWDVVQGGATAPTPAQMEKQDFSHLLDVQVELEDHLYSQQLDSALFSLEAGTKQDQGFWTLPIEEVLPAPQNIPESFRGKSWVQIEKEDEEKVNTLVRQFREERFICYFDSESLARYGRRSQSSKKPGENVRVTPTKVLPLLEHDSDDITHVKRRRSFRPASRCQAVKVSRSTQTTPLVIPAVHPPAPKAPPTTTISDKNGAERTPNMQVWRRLPACYSNIVTPVQLHTSLVYLLCSPPDSTPTQAGGATPRRGRRRRRSPKWQTLKYKRLPVQVYEPRTNRILRKLPKSSLLYTGSAPSAPAHPCVRQLFRSLSPDLNSDRAPGQLNAEKCFQQSALSRESAQTAIVRRRRGSAQALGPPLGRRAGRYKDREDRTKPPPPRSRFRLQALPLQPRREGLRPACPGRKHLPSISHAPFGSHHGKGQRGRGYKRRGRSFCFFKPRYTRSFQ